MKATFSTLIEVIRATSDAPNAFRRCVNPTARSNPVRTPFYTVFMAFHKLIVEDKKQPVDAFAVMDAIKGLASKLKADSHHVRTDDRKKNIDLTYGLLQGHFVSKDPPLLGHGKGLSLDFHNALLRSKIETPRYEFKQGIHRLYDGRTRDEAVLNKIVEEACAIANLGPESKGYIFIGVADKEADAKRVQELDNVIPIKVGNIFVVGVEREAKLAKLKLDNYIKLIVAHIRASLLSDPLKSDLLGNFDTVDYRGMSVVMITLPPQNAVSWVGDHAFIREGSETKEASPKQVALLVDRFSNAKK